MRKVRKLSRPKDSQLPSRVRFCSADLGYMQARALCYYDVAKREPLFSALVEPLAARFGLTELDIRHHFLRYNLGWNAENNDTYLLLGTRFALFVDYLANNTWFSRRLDCYNQFIKGFDHVLDIGFGIPLAWLIACAGKDVPTGHFTLLDFSESALDFASEFIMLAKQRFPREIERLQHILVLGRIEACNDWPVVHPEAVIALDCIEHAANASQCLRGIYNRLHGSTFLVGLPVGTPIPQHTIDFNAEEDAIAFVRRSGLLVQDAYLVRATWDSDLVGNPGFEGSLFIKAV